MTAKKPHPGQITYVDGDTNTEKTLELTLVPEPLRFAPNEHGEAVAVVRVISRIAGNQRFIREFGAAGEFLRSTVQRAP